MWLLVHAEKSIILKGIGTLSTCAVTLQEETILLHYYSYVWNTCWSVIKYFLSTYWLSPACISHWAKDPWLSVLPSLEKRAGQTPEQCKDELNSLVFMSVIKPTVLSPDRRSQMDDLLLQMLLPIPSNGIAFWKVWSHLNQVAPCFCTFLCL